MDSNLPAYHIYRIGELYYSFTTDSGAAYECSFQSYAEYFYAYPEIASKVFSLNLSVTNSSKKVVGTDKRIALTVIKIVGDFLNSKINAVVYVCDPSDGKGLVRARKFKSWFDYISHPSHQIMEISTGIDAGGIRLYTVLLVHQKNKLKKQFIKAYIELTNFDDDEK
jgi:Family of unknown function (DUF6169)